MKRTILAILILAGALSAPASASAAEWQTAKMSTYGWPGDGPYQPLAGCGYRKIGPPNAGQRLPCNLSPSIIGVAVVHGVARLGERLSFEICVDGTCGRYWLRVIDYCGPGCARNGVLFDISWGGARRTNFGYAVREVRWRK